MNTKQHKVVVTDLLINDPDHANLLEERAVLEPLGACVEIARASDEDSIISAADGAVGLIVTYASITRRVLEALPNLKVVVKCGIGFDNLDTRAAEELDIYTVNVPDYGEEEVAAHALGLTLDGIRAIGRGVEEVARGGWALNLPSLHLSRPSSLTIGVLGMGRIANKFLEYVSPLTMNLRYYDPYVRSHTRAIATESIQELFSVSDVVSLHVPLNGSTKGLVADEALSSARPGLILINTSRAGLVDRSALAHALHVGRVAHYGSDVWWDEPPGEMDRVDRSILEHPRVSVTPHIAWYSEHSDRELRQKAASEVARVIRGKRPLNVVRHPSPQY